MPQPSKFTPAAIRKLFEYVDDHCGSQGLLNTDRPEAFADIIAYITPSLPPDTSINARSLQSKFVSLAKQYAPTDKASITALFAHGTSILNFDMLVSDGIYTEAEAKAMSMNYRKKVGQSAFFTPAMIRFLIDFIDNHKGSDSIFLSDRDAAVQEAYEAMLIELPEEDYKNMTFDRVRNRIDKFAAQKNFNGTLARELGLSGPRNKQLYEYGKLLLLLDAFPAGVFTNAEIEAWKYPQRTSAASNAAGGNPLKRKAPDDTVQDSDYSPSSDDDGFSRPPKRQILILKGPTSARDYASKTEAPSSPSADHTIPPSQEMLPQTSSDLDTILSPNPPQQILRPETPSQQLPPAELSDQQSPQSVSRQSRQQTTTFVSPVPQSDELEQMIRDEIDDALERIPVDTELGIKKATDISKAMEDIMFYASTAVTDRISSADLNPYDPVTVNFDLLDKDLCELLSKVLCTDNARIKEQWSRFREMHAGQALSLSIFVQSLLGAAISQWVLEQKPQGDKLDAVPSSLLRVLQKRIPDAFRKFQKEALQQDLDKYVVPKVEETARQLAARFIDATYQYLGRAPEKGMELIIASGVRMDHDSFETPRGQATVQWREYYGSGPKAWETSWRSRLVEVFRMALKLRIQMEKMEADFRINFPTPGESYGSTDDGEDEQTRVGTCMIGISSQIQGRFRDWDTGELGETLPCASARYYKLLQ